MKNAMHDILLFGAGFAAGAYFMHTVMRRAYDEKYRKEVQDLKAHWEKREANLDEEVEKKANQKGFELAMGPYRTESDPEDIRKPEQAIEIIEPDEFGADEDYETGFLSFYADGKLVFDGEDEPMDEDDISRTIGDEALKHFGEFMPSTIHNLHLEDTIDRSYFDKMATKAIEAISEYGDFDQFASNDLGEPPWQKPDIPWDDVQDEAAQNFDVR